MKGCFLKAFCQGEKTKQKQFVSAAEWVGIDLWLIDIHLSDDNQECLLLDVHQQEDQLTF